MKHDEAEILYKDVLLYIRAPMIFVGVMMLLAWVSKIFHAPDLEISRALFAFLILVIGWVLIYGLAALVAYRKFQENLSDDADE